MALADPPEIETERLVLRAHRVQDIDEMLAMWSDPVVTRYIGGRIFSREEVWSKLLRYAGSWSLLGHGYWVIRDRRSGAFLGEVGFLDLHREITPPLGTRPELGFALVAGSHGQGLGTEAARAALAWGDRAWGTAATVCLISPENEPSLRLARRLGYMETARAEYRGAAVTLHERRGQA